MTRKLLEALRFAEGVGILNYPGPTVFKAEQGFAADGSPQKSRMPHSAESSRTTLQGGTLIAAPGPERYPRTILQSRLIQACCSGSRHRPGSVPNVFRAGKDRCPPKRFAQNTD